ncbi:hypothetical protein, partial [Acinetobacter baumannii]|uniref:hypothetical protein n=1 Tax=Acinetobacter baumannii TaxID=470 RepID=UPI003ED9749F
NAEAPQSEPTKAEEGGNAEAPQSEPTKAEEGGNAIRVVIEHINSQLKTFRILDLLRKSLLQVHPVYQCIFHEIYIEAVFTFARGLLDLLRKSLLQVHPVYQC